MSSYKSHFSACLEARPERLHFAAHSHHPWPNVSAEAHQQYWRDSAAMLDAKWGHIMQAVYAPAQEHVARVLEISDSKTIAWAPNTHDLFVRLFSCLLPGWAARKGAAAAPLRVLTSDGEFHSFRRQMQRYAEVPGLVEVTRVPTQPFDSFSERFLSAAAEGEHDLVYVSHVFFDSGLVFDGIDESPAAVRSDHTLIAVDGYHSFCALPVDLSRIEHRVFFLAGGYKYAMAGEGGCFIHCPPGQAPRPMDTGWFAELGLLESAAGSGEVPYGPDGTRFLGATFDPSALYRFNAVMDLLQRLELTPARVHEHVRGLQEYFLDAVDSQPLRDLDPDRLLPPRGTNDRGHFLTYRMEDSAAPWLNVLKEREKVVTDQRGDRWRIGFGIYHDADDVDELVRRIADAQ